MESDQGFAIELEKPKEGRKVFYRYSKRDFSINNSPINTTEAEYLKNVISILHRFEGAPGFEWISEMSTMLTDKFDLKDSNKKVMSYDSNIDYCGYKFITPIFNAIVNKRVLMVKYEPFGKEPFEFHYHPYFLKQYNNRWFVFGRNPKYENITNLALDRIISFVIINKEYIYDAMKIIVTYSLLKIISTTPLHNLLYLITSLILFKQESIYAIPILVLNIYSLFDPYHLLLLLIIPLVILSIHKKSIIKETKKKLKNIYQPNSAKNIIDEEPVVIIEDNYWNLSKEPQKINFIKEIEKRNTIYHVSQKQSYRRNLLKFIKNNLFKN
jgi:hypothetical protein